MKKFIVGVFFAALLTASLPAAFVEGYLNTPDGLTSGDDGWSNGEGGYRVTWEITQNGSVWHYEYTFSKADGSALVKETSHFIIALSENIVEGVDVYNFTGDVDPEALPEFGTFEAGNENPGFPAGESISGIKINLAGAHTVVGFDSTRAPMWGDFYAKDGKTGDLWNYAYNTDLGVTAANATQYWNPAVDGDGTALYKVLVPDTIPEPATLALLGLGGLTLLRRRR
jgi:hypothetical protein